MTYVTNGEGTHKDTVEEQVAPPLEGEDGAVLGRRVSHGVESGRLETESKSGRASSNGVDVEGSNGRDRVDRHVLGVSEGKTDSEDEHFCNVAGEEVEQELGQVLEDTATLLASTSDGGKVVIGENNLKRQLVNTII